MSIWKNSEFFLTIQELDTVLCEMYPDFDGFDLDINYDDMSFQIDCDGDFELYTTICSFLDNFQKTIYSWSDYLSELPLPLGYSNKKPDTGELYRIFEIYDTVIEDYATIFVGL